MKIESPFSTPAGNAAVPPPDIPSRAKSLRNVFPWLGCLYLFAITFAVHFRDFKQLGLYEDDYWSISPYLNASVRQLWPLFVHNMTSWPQGRPLNHFLPLCLSSLGSSLGGLHGVYFLAFLWLSFNCLLVFRALRRLVGPQAALFGALAYALFPADTTHSFLTHAGHVQGSMTFLLLAVNLYLSNGWIRALAYPVAGLSLISYETAFLPFLAAPLLRANMTRKFAGRFLIHLAICAAIIGSIALIRFSLHEDRALTSIQSPTVTLWRMVSSLWIGPETVLKAYQLALISVFSSFSAVSLGIAGVGALAFWGLTRGSLKSPAKQMRPFIKSVRRGLALFCFKASAWLHPTLFAQYRKLDNISLRKPSCRLSLLTSAGLTPLGLIGVGLVTVCISYLLTIINYPPTIVMGRLTSVHTAAAWGSALTLAALFQMLWGFVLWRQFALYAGSFLVFFLANYGCIIERGYLQSWALQKLFWRQLAASTPDLKGNTSVIIIARHPVQNVVINSNSWADYFVLMQLTQYCQKTGQYPALAFLGKEQTYHNFPFWKIDGERLSWKPDPTLSKSIEIDEANIILLRLEGVTLTRIDSWPIPSLNRVLHSMPPGTETDFWNDKTPLGKMILGRGKRR